MRDFRRLSNLAAWQSVPVRSKIHKLDPRTRLLSFVALLSALVLSRRAIPAAILLAIVTILVVLAQISLKNALRTVSMALPWLLVVALLQVALRIGDKPDCPVILDWRLLRVSTCSVLFALLTLVRFVGLMLLITLLMSTMSITDLVHGTESLLDPLDKIGLPGHQLAMVGAIALRFVPTMAMEAERLVKAQAARGAELGAQRASLRDRVRRVLPLVVPIFVLALRRAERLAEAMEARAYGASARGRHARLRMEAVDWLVLASVLILVAFVLFVNVWLRI